LDLETKINKIIQIRKLGVLRLKFEAKEKGMGNFIWRKVSRNFLNAKRDGLPSYLT